MNSGPTPEGGPLPPRKPPGEFVSEELQTDCARFLDELRALVRLRHERPAAKTAWAPDDRAK
jgi:hypothetical protein